MQISEINIYPIKSLKGIELKESRVEKRGLEFDRRWMLTDPEGMFLTQREVPKMATIGVEIEAGTLTVSAEGVGSLRVPFEPDSGDRQAVTIWQSTVDSVVYKGPVSEWFSDALSKKCQLVVMPETTERHVAQQFDLGDDVVSFADGYPLLLLGQASVDDLNGRIAENAEQAFDAERGDKAEFVPPEPYPMNRFRPSVVVSGSGPFEEDGWARIRIGEVRFRVAKPCARCVITTIDQDKGEFAGKDPLKTLATFRLGKQIHPETFESMGQTANAVLFGENLIPEVNGGIISLNDEVEVLERRPR